MRNSVAGNAHSSVAIEIGRIDGVDGCTLLVTAYRVLTLQAPEARMADSKMTTYRPGLTALVRRTLARSRACRALVMPQQIP